MAWWRELGAPIVVKQDGLAAGKGVVVPSTDGETVDAITLPDRTRARSCSKNA